MSRGAYGPARALRDLLLALEHRHERAARVLHDDIGQVLTAAVLELELGGDAPLPPEVREGVLAGLRSSLVRVRDLALELRSPRLAGQTLAEALRWEAQRQAAAAGIELTLALAGPTSRDDAAELAALAIAREALANAARHARARRWRVALTAKAGALALCIEDDGIGLAASTDGRGLRAMHAYAALLGGDCRIAPRAGGGTCVAARLPLPG